MSFSGRALSKCYFQDMLSLMPARHVAGRTGNRSGCWRGAAGGLSESGTEGARAAFPVPH